VTAFWRHRNQQTFTALGPSPGGCSTVGSPRTTDGVGGDRNSPSCPLKRPSHCEDQAAVLNRKRPFAAG
jgi:hypothetical protein